MFRLNSRTLPRKKSINSADKVAEMFAEKYAGVGRSLIHSLSKTLTDPWKVDVSIGIFLDTIDVMDKLIQKKLRDNDKCLVSIKCFLIEHDQRSLCTIAIVENLEDHCAFIYTLSKQSTDDPRDLVLLKTIPVDASFSFTSTGSQSGAQSPAIIKLGNLQNSFLCELLPGEKLTTLSTELKRAKQIYSQNAGFGLPSTFGWIDKYNRQSTLSSKSNASQMSASGGLLEQNLVPLSGQGAASNEWPFDAIIQLSVGGQCPIVKDMTMHNSASSGSLKNAMNNLVPEISKLAVPTTMKSANLRQSPDRSPSPSGNSCVLPVTGAGGGGREVLATYMMKKRELEYTELYNYRVFCGTWNVNGQSAQADLQDWLAPDEDKENPPDIYAIAFQELDLSKNVYIFSESAREEEWLVKVKKALHSGRKYKQVKLIRLVAMMLIVFVRESLEKQVRELEFQTIGTGLLGMMGNKGGVAIRFKLHDTTICFVNSHLAAHMEEYERRNQDFRDITSRLNFRSADKPLYISDHDSGGRLFHAAGQATANARGPMVTVFVAGMNRSPDAAERRCDQPAIELTGIHYFDSIVFWLGDLNYRISDIDSDECKKKILKGELHDLMNYDQLCRQIALKRVFLDYLEGPISFTPTYKYDPGSDNWDSSDKCRTPAWCDRVLWRGENIKQNVYRSHPKLKLSDHKPVSAVFEVGIKVFDPVLERRVREDVMKQLDQKENEFLPQVSLDMTDVHFENLKFIETQRRTVSITNTGQVPVQFEFINKPTDSHYCKQWLQILPPRGFINIGERFNIDLEVQIDKKTAPELTTGKHVIDDILVLHLQGGKDFFITISGTYLPSCFGSSIETLVAMFGPMHEPLLAINAASSEDKDRPLDIPKELWYLVDFLFKYGLDQDELFQLNGLRCEIKQIRDCLDSGSFILMPTNFHVHSVAEALLMFLDSLAEPVIPYRYYFACLDAASFSMCRQILSQISTSHRNVFKYVCAFLRELLVHSARNKLDIKLLATLFGNILLRSPAVQDSSSASRSREEELKCTAFMQNFLLNEYDD